MADDGSTSEKVLEQAYFDRAAVRREQKRAARQRCVTAAGDSKAARALWKMTRHDPTLSATDEEIAFMRITCVDGELFYVGRCGLHSGAESLVYAWQAPRIMRMREATSAEPEDVVSHRHYRTTGNVVIGWREQILSGAGQAGDPDALLVEALEAGRGPAMQHMVPTLQPEQSKVVRKEPASLLLVHGGPGSGKTAVALHRLSWWLHHHPGHEDQVAVISRSGVLARFVRDVLPQLGSHGVLHADLTSLLVRDLKLRGDLAPAAPGDGEWLKGDVRMLDVIAEGLRQQIGGDPRSYSFTMRGTERTFDVSPEEIRELVRRSATGRYADGRKNFRVRLVAMVACKIDDRQGTGFRPGGAEELVVADEISEVVEAVWPAHSPTTFLRELFASKSLLSRAAANLLSEEEIDHLYSQVSAAARPRRWTPADVVLLDVVADSMGVEVPLYEHIVIDEAQDLTPMELTAVRRRSTRGSMTVVGDLAQSTGPFARDSWDDVRRALQSSAPFLERRLERGYRVPGRVMVLARRVLDSAELRRSAPTAVRQGSPPRSFAVDRQQDVVRAVMRSVVEHRAAHRYVGIIGVLEDLPDIERALTGAGVGWADIADGAATARVRTTTALGSKGLEFDAVVVVNPRSILDSDAYGDRLLYIALTRTTCALDIVHLHDDLPLCLRPLPGTRTSPGIKPAP